MPTVPPETASSVASFGLASSTPDSVANTGVVVPEPAPQQDDESEVIITAEEETVPEPVVDPPTDESSSQANFTVDSETVGTFKRSSSTFNVPSLAPTNTVGDSDSRRRAEHEPCPDGRDGSANVEPPADERPTNDDAFSVNESDVASSRLESFGVVSSVAIGLPPRTKSNRRLSSFRAMSASQEQQHHAAGRGTSVASSSAVPDFSIAATSQAPISTFAASTEGDGGFSIAATSNVAASVHGGEGAPSVVAPSFYTSVADGDAGRSKTNDEADDEDFTIRATTIHSAQGGGQRVTHGRGVGMPTTAAAPSQRLPNPYAHVRLYETRAEQESHRVCMRYMELLEARHEAGRREAAIRTARQVLSTMIQQR